MPNVLEHLEADCQRYRNAVNQLLAVNHSKPNVLRAHFLEVRVAASQLYLDYVTLFRDMPQIQATRTERSSSTPKQRAVECERDVREQFRARLRPSQIWTHFRPDNSFAEMNRLTTLEEYLNSIELHLPEIYGETLRIEIDGREFLQTNDSGSLAYLLVGLEHAGRNHISFVQRALDWLADEDSWED